MPNDLDTTEFPAEQYPYRIRGWRKFQHYKYRNPPWVKLHTSVLSSEWWVMLPDASRVLACACIMIASKFEGHLPASMDYIKRIAYLDRLPNLKPLIECGFLENMLADASACKQMLPNADTETETELKKERSSSTVAVDGVSMFEQFWKAYPRKVGKKVAEKALVKALKEVSLETIIQAIAHQKPLWSDPKFIPHPATWLNAGRWADEVPRGNGGAAGPPVTPEEAERLRERYYRKQAEAV